MWQGNRGVFDPATWAGPIGKVGRAPNSATSFHPVLQKLRSTHSTDTMEIPESEFQWVDTNALLLLCQRGTNFPANMAYHRLVSNFESEGEGQVYQCVFMKEMLNACFNKNTQ
jgi:hypothetical protein